MPPWPWGPRAQPHSHTQPGGACALQGPCLSPATPSHLPAWPPLRPPSPRSRASPGCQACTGVDVACWSFGVYEHGHFHDGMCVSQRECVGVRLCLGLTGHVCVSVTMSDSVRVCMHPSLRSPRGRLPPDPGRGALPSVPFLECRKLGALRLAAGEEGVTHSVRQRTAGRGAPIVAVRFRGRGASEPS